MELLEMLAKAQAVYDEAKQGHALAAWEATLPIQQAAIDMGKGMGFKSTADDERLKGEIVTKLTAARDECDKPAPKGAAQPVGSWGDGTFLKILLDALVKILPELLKK